MGIGGGTTLRRGINPPPGVATGAKSQLLRT